MEMGSIANVIGDCQIIRIVGQEVQIMAKLDEENFYPLGAPIPFLILDPESRMSIMTDFT